MYSDQEKEILVDVENVVSRYFNLSDLVINNLPHQIENDDLYTLEEVAEILSMSIVTIRQYVRQGKLKAIKQWKNWMVPSNAIAKMIYERKNGKKLRENETMLVIVAGDLYEEDSSIRDYQIITAGDLLANINANSSVAIDDYIYTVMPNQKEHLIYIEATSNINNFFRRTGDIVFSDLSKVEAPLESFLPEEKKALSHIISNRDHLIVENPNEALLTIKELFGEPEDVYTVLKIYKALLEVAGEEFKGQKKGDV
ncbi:helix-turn-helix domain-containing protein [Salisediminibacterium selenitireducens]|nr:helix-turn-helix domain-containing protein [Salisediminibacterium selenitireducens]